ncbi:hypothetical protein C2869_08100 [Saccharobesus litoralis]|uniref:YgjP-like metallopeptidase domain-containing protein n=1 Tax=Saccharobesus litoralis TaxID=2172099 RepID=A0A2S0VQA6_9ALTE|nr:SprT family zinc-dependent metalloprotease [Saccharobesus litoralis]AWB66391.1 hypothetical protein C2869_08100 [Saccharobesus litoralis]
MPFDYLIKHSARRKTISVIVQKGQVRVLVPTWLPEADIRDMVHSKQAWIESKLAEQSDILAEQAHNEVISRDSQFLLFGEPIKLEVSLHSKTEFCFATQDNVLALFVSSRVNIDNQQAYLQKLLQDFYSQQLSSYLTSRLPELAAQMALSYRSWQVKNYKAKWGSCNSRQELAFNWRLAAMPEPVVDSVIIHELAHLKHLDHSRQFWRLVSRFDPQYKQHKQALKDLTVFCP